MNEKYALAAKRASCILGLICKTVDGRPRELIHPYRFFGTCKAAPGVPTIDIQQQVQ